MSRVKMPHPQHASHLCYLTNLNYHIAEPKVYKSLVKDAGFVCRICGRAAAKKVNLCKPVKL